MKKILSIALVALLAMALVAGCAAPPPPQPPAPGVSPGAPTPPPTPGAAPPEASAVHVPTQTVFTILYPSEAFEVHPSQMEAFIVREQESGIRIEWDSPPLADFMTRYNVLMGSGMLPDAIINVPTGDIFRYGNLGAFLPLNELMRDHAPHFMELYNSVQEIRDGVTESDGNIYFFPMLNENIGGNRPWAIRLDWLEALDLDIPETIEDWEMVLTAFRDYRPNGLDDIIPLSGYVQGRRNGLFNILEISGAWGIGDSMFRVDANGTNEVQFVWTSDEWREVLQVAARWYAEGLIDREIVTNDATAFNARVGQNLVGAFKLPINGHLVAFNQTLPDSIPGLEYIAVPPIRGETYQIHAGSITHRVRGNGRAVITNAVQDPITLTQWFDHWYSPEGILLIRMGTYPRFHTFDDEGFPVFTEYVTNNPNGLPQRQVQGMISPAMSQFPHWSAPLGNPNVPTITPWAYHAQNVALLPFLDESLRFRLAPNLNYEAEIDAERRNLAANIESFAEEAIVNFVLGRLDFYSDWDTFVAQIEGMGVERLVEIVNNAHQERLAVLAAR